MPEVPKGPAPEYGSKDNQQKQHDERKRAFADAGWSSLDVSCPFYNYPATAPEGTVMTVADVVTESPTTSALEWFKIEGDTVPPEGMWYGRSVWKVKGGKWERIKEEYAGE